MKKKAVGVYVIAEAGVNHNGSLDRAKELVDIAVAAGANAVKFQTFKAENLVVAGAEKAEYQKNTTSATESQYEMLKRLELDYEAHWTLLRYCKDKGIDFLSTPFDEESLSFLAKKMDLPYIKISSGDITNAPFLLKVAQAGKKVFLSTGMSYLGEVETALQILAYGYSCGEEKGVSWKKIENAYCSAIGQECLKANVTLLHCTTEYPAPTDEVNLKAINVLRNAFALKVGYSDHTAGIAVSLAAVALGAVVIEKHFTIDKTLQGPDHRASLEYGELKEMIAGIRMIEKSLGTAIKSPSYSEFNNRAIARKSLTAKRKIVEGEQYTTENITAKRPGDGITPLHYWEVIGKVADRDYNEDEQVKGWVNHY